MVHLDIADEDTYEVEEILNHRKTANGYEYEVKWKGYDDTDNTWIHESQMDSPLLKREYHNKVKQRIERFSQNDGLNRASGINRRKTNSGTSEFEDETMPSSSSKTPNQESAQNVNKSKSSKSTKISESSKQRRRAMVIDASVKNTPTSSKSKQKNVISETIEEVSENVEKVVSTVPKIIENQNESTGRSSKDVKTMIDSIVAGANGKNGTVINIPADLTMKGTDDVATLQNIEPISTTQAETILQPEKETSSVRPTLLAENNEIPTNVQKRRYRKLRTPPPLPNRNKSNKKVNENNELSSNSSSRSNTPLTNLNIQEKNPLVETVVDNIPINDNSKNLEKKMKIITIEEEDESEPIFENIEDMLESNQDSPEDVEMEKEKEVEKQQSHLLDIPEDDDEEVPYEETISALEKGYRVTQILKMGVQEGITFALLQYTHYNVCEWVDVTIVKQFDPNILIHYFESMFREAHNI